MREALTAKIVIEMLLQGVHFSSIRFRNQHTSKSRTTRVLRALADSGAIMNSGVRGKGKYRFTDEFLASVSQEIGEGMPRGTFLHYPSLKVFDVCGIGRWTSGELEDYVNRLREHWRIRSGQLDQ
jgi:hypothetical protein